MQEAAGSVMALVRRLRAVRYDWRPDNPLGLSGSDIGVLAQEVEEVFPELVITDPSGIKRVDYRGLTAPLIEAVKELDSRLERVEARLGQLTGEPSEVAR